ncbi:MAG: adenosylcobinamide-GDP ribazoletransferase [Ferruginibacter sp.]|nr:adenosylcobinamide-GDP ribazoletransferase [Ferruginibacter sp.]
MKKEIRIFFTALMFYTRIPCPQFADHNPEYLNKATRYFPLMGWIVGGIVALSFYLFEYLLNMPMAILLSTITGIFVTGAFHEDGFADVCDGFGGGWNNERILEIMKDSRTGAYGSIGIALMLLTKMTAIYTAPPVHMGMLIIAAHSFSRLCPVLLMTVSTYVRENEDSKAKPLAKAITAAEIIPACIFGMFPLLYFGIYATVIILPLLGMIYLRYYFHKWIGGYTGDCLGTVQQVSEVLFYIGMIMLWKFF